MINLISNADSILEQEGYSFLLKGSLLGGYYKEIYVSSKISSWAMIFKEKLILNKELDLKTKNKILNQFSHNFPNKTVKYEEMIKDIEITINNTIQVVVNSLISAYYLIEKKQFLDAKVVLRKVLENTHYINYLLRKIRENDITLIFKFYKKYISDKVSKDKKRDIKGLGNDVIFSDNLEEKNYIKIFKNKINYNLFEKLCEATHFSLGENSKLKKEVNYNEISQEEILEGFSIFFGLFTYFILVLDEFDYLKFIKDEEEKIKALTLFLNTSVIPLMVRINQKDYIFNKSISHKKVSKELEKMLLKVDIFFKNGIEESFSNNNLKVDLEKILKMINKIYRMNNQLYITDMLNSKKKKTEYHYYTESSFIIAQLGDFLLNLETILLDCYREYNIYDIAYIEFKDLKDKDYFFNKQQQYFELCNKFESRKNSQSKDLNTLNDYWTSILPKKIILNY